MTPERMFEIAEPILRAKGWDVVELMQPERQYETDPKKKVVGVRALRSGTSMSCWNGWFVSALRGDDGQPGVQESEVIRSFSDDMPDAFPAVAVLCESKERASTYNREEKLPNNTWAFSIFESANGLRLDEIQLRIPLSDQGERQALYDTWLPRLKPGGKAINQDGTTFGIKFDPETRSPSP